MGFTRSAVMVSENAGTFNVSVAVFDPDPRLVMNFLSAEHVLIVMAVSDSATGKIQLKFLLGFSYNCAFVLPFRK